MYTQYATRHNLQREPGAIEEAVYYLCLVRSVFWVIICKFDSQENKSYC